MKYRNVRSLRRLTLSPILHLTQALRSLKPLGRHWSKWRTRATTSQALLARFKRHNNSLSKLQLTVKTISTLTLRNSSELTKLNLSTSTTRSLSRWNKRGSSWRVNVRGSDTRQPNRPNFNFTRGRTNKPLSRSSHDDIRLVNRIWIKRFGKIQRVAKCI